MKKTTIIFILVMLLVIMVACENNKSPIASIEKKSRVEGATFGDSEAEDISGSEVTNATGVSSCGLSVANESEKAEYLLDETDLPVFSDDKNINQKYYDAIVTLETTGMLPDGKYCYSDGEGDYYIKKQKAYEDYVAVCDINDDGQNELLIRIGGTNNSDSAEYVFRYDSQGFFELLFEYYIGLEYYPNGVIYANVPHSQYITGDDFWPYELYQYDYEKKEYYWIATVHELDVNFSPECENSFSHEDDIDNDGILYCVYYGKDIMYKDVDEYVIWKDNYIRIGKKEIKWFLL